MQFLYFFALVAVAECVSIENIISTKKILDTADDLVDDIFANPNPETCMSLNIGHHTSPSGLSGLGDVERLVVYVYRTKATSDVFIFTPKTRFQPCFPDLASDEEGDLLVVDSNQLQGIFNSNSNIIPMDYYSDGAKFGFSPDFGDAGFDYHEGSKRIRHVGIGPGRQKIQELLNSNPNIIPMDYNSDGDKNDFSPDFGDAGFDYHEGSKRIRHVGIVPGRPKIQELLNSNPSIIPMDYNSDGDKNDFSPEFGDAGFDYQEGSKRIRHVGIVPGRQKIQELLNSNPNIIPMDYNSDNGDKDDFSPDFGDAMGLSYVEGNKRIRPIVNVPGKQTIQYDNEFGIPTSNTHFPAPNKYLPIPVKERGDGYDEQAAEYYYPAETSVTDSSYPDGNIFLPHTHGKEKTHGEIEDFFDNRKEIQKIPGFNPIKTADNLYNAVSGSDIFLPFRTLLGNHLTFDDWFMQQLYRFGERLDQNINVRMLKSKIEKILHDNRIFIRNDGILTDHRGMVINPSNLQIRPILIGDSVAYRKILSLSDGFFSFPTNSPYLDTVVINQAYPPKLLGIIPLGKTFIPKSIKGRVINPWPRYPNSIFSKINNIVSLHSDENPSPSLVPKKRNVSNEPFPIIKNFRKASDTTESNETNSTESGQRNNPITSILNVYKSLIGQALGKIAKPVLDSEMPSEDSESEQKPSEVSEYEDLEMDDDLGFKIIGGKPAISSGTPLSNKGRSARFFDGFP